jgi:hypothetical protein
MTVPLRKSTVVWITVLVAVATIAAFGIAQIVNDPELKKTLQNAAITLVFGALLGGVAKMLLDDLDRRRQLRADDAQFVRNVLADLKAVYDRVERARILLPAHQSALTFGNEMRDLIEARVQLLNVYRALHGRPKRLKRVRRQVESMQGYLRTLTDAFQREYKRIADLQIVHEARIKARLDKNPEAAEFPPNEPWEELCELPEVQDFIGASSSLRGIQAGQGAKPQEQVSNYDKEFCKRLDKATEILREELQEILS